jgi:hypothetical protein
LKILSAADCEGAEDQQRAACFHHWYSTCCVQLK